MQTDVILHTPVRQHPQLNLLLRRGTLVVSLHATYGSTMKRLLTFGLLLFSVLPLRSQTVSVATIDGPITPAVADYLQSTIRRASDDSATCLVIKMNTPGGLLKSTRVIVSSMLTAEIPIIVYVTPPGSQAASAGTFITLAAHVAVMSTGTNIGAASPIALQGEMDSVAHSKAMNDAVAFIRTIAEARKKNADWAETAVTKAASITEQEALKNNVIDFIASDFDDLLKKLDGKVIALPHDTVTIVTQNAKVRQIGMSFVERLLDLFSDPNIAYILFLLGIYGLFFEIYNPGSILPGVVGGICILLALYSLHTLPIDYTGVALILFGIILFLLEIKVTSYGLLSIGGVISFVLGSMMLIRTGPGMEFLELSLSVIIASAIVTALFFAFIVGLGLKAQTRTVTSGEEGMKGLQGKAETALKPTGTVIVHGERWNARVKDEAIEKGAVVKVTEIEGLTLVVEPVRTLSHTHKKEKE